jgi:hypothetical protein
MRLRDIMPVLPIGSQYCRLAERNESGMVKYLDKEVIYEDELDPYIDREVVALFIAEPADGPALDIIIEAEGEPS